MSFNNTFFCLQETMEICNSLGIAVEQVYLIFILIYLLFTHIQKIHI